MIELIIKTKSGNKKISFHVRYLEVIATLVVFIPILVVIYLK
jgi:hypothetical protein